MPTHHVITEYSPYFRGARQNDNTLVFFFSNWSLSPLLVSCPTSVSVLPRLDIYASLLTCVRPPSSSERAVAPDVSLDLILVFLSRAFAFPTSNPDSHLSHQTILIVPPSITSTPLPPLQHSRHFLHQSYTLLVLINPITHNSTRVSLSL